MHMTLKDWASHEAVPCSLEQARAFNTAIDLVMASLDPAVELLGFGEALHGGEDILILRNKLFQRLVEAHGYSAIAIESGFPHAHVANEYVSGRGPATYEEVQDTGFSHGFGRLEANRELIEWMRAYNADPSHSVKLHFYGLDVPILAKGGTASPRQVLSFGLDYLAELDEISAQEHRVRIEASLGQDIDWENPMPWRDPKTSPDRLAATNALRIEAEELMVELRTRRPELVAGSDEGRYLEALQCTSIAQQLLNYYAALAQKPDEQLVSSIFGIRDAMIAEVMTYVVSRERGRGKVLTFAHNSHLQRGQARIQAGPVTYSWWPAGSHIKAMLGSRYAVIGSAVGVSEANGIGQPEPGTLEALLTAIPGPLRFIPTHQGQGLPTSEITNIPVRSGSTKNPTYMTPLSAQAFTDFDWLAVLDATAYTRGGQGLQ